MMEVGGAKKGTRTMVDALLEGMVFLTQSNGIPTVGKLAKFVREGADQAKQLPGVLGRSGYLGDKCIGLPEPGCELAALLFESFP